MPESIFAFSDSNRLYRLQIADSATSDSEANSDTAHNLAGYGGMLLHSWVMREGLGETAEIHLQTLTLQAQADTQALLGQTLIIWTRLANRQEHPRSGIVTAVRNLGSDGGFTRWHITLQSWPALLALQRRSQVWQEQSVVAIIDSILRHYAGISTPADTSDAPSPATTPSSEQGDNTAAGWIWSACALQRLQQSHRQGIRSYIIQYRETDLEFFRRLLAEEHLTWREQTHPQDPARQQLIILADSSNPQSCPPDITGEAPGGIGLHGQGSPWEENTIYHLHAHKRLHTAELDISSWDYLSKHSLRHKSRDTAAASDTQIPQWKQDMHLADRRYSSPSDAQHHLHHIRSALQAARLRHTGDSGIRTLAAGRRLRLQNSARHNLHTDTTDGDDIELLPIRVIHAGLNNLPESLIAADPEQRRQALSWLPAWVDETTAQRAAQLGYANRFEALPAATAWLPLYCKADGQILPGNAPRRPRPGLLRATVTDAQGAGKPGELHMDALGRIRIRFDFQQTAQDTQSAAEHTSTSSCWVRVLQRLTGPGWGSQYIPRIGQEVLVDFIDGDIHRPLVIGSLYNGLGEGAAAPTPGGQRHNDAADNAPFTAGSDHCSSGQGNRVAGGHSPAWHAQAPQAAESGGYNNADALSGHKTVQYPQPHAAGADHNQLVFDDSNRQLRVQMATAQAATQLNLGHLIHQADNYRGSFRGQGFELRTDAYGAVRGGRGVLISSYGSRAQDAAWDNTGGIALARQLHSLAQGAQSALETHHNPGFAAQAGSRAAHSSMHHEGEAAVGAHLSSIKGMVSSAGMQAAQTDAHNYNTHTGQGFTAEMQPQNLPGSASALVQIASSESLIATAAHGHHLSAGEHIVQGSGEHLQSVSGGHTCIHTGQAIGILAGMLDSGLGMASGAQNTAALGGGLNVTAAQGRIVLQAQDGQMRLAARSDVEMGSACDINWSAAKRIRLRTAGGACITVEAGQIEVQCPGSITIHAGQRQFVGPATVSQQMNQWSESRFDQELFVEDMQNNPRENMKFELLRPNGDIRGVTASDGSTRVQKSDSPEQVRVRLRGIKKT